MLSGSLDIQSIDYDFDKNLQRKQMRKTFKETKKQYSSEKNQPLEFIPFLSERNNLGKLIKID